MAIDAGLLRPTLEELMQIYRVKYYRFGEPGWGPKLRLAAGYFTPDDYYEALVAKLVVSGASWADVGCGRDIFPSHPDLARELSARAGYVLGIDPDENVHENPFVTERFQGLIQDYHAERRFDVITLRMVAEHIVDPASAMRKLAEMLNPGGAIVIYTPYKWAPMSVIATVVPFRLHNPLKRLIWGSDSRDTFPTAYRMNTRADLLRHARAAGLSEASFELLDDCRVTQNFKLLNRIEIGVRGVLNRVGLHYPELCILAVYRSPASAAHGDAATQGPVDR